MDRKISICAVIVAYEPNESIIRLYDSIREQVDEIIIIDNASCCEKSKQILQNLSQKVRVIYNDKNYGVAKALNQGAEYAIGNNYKWLLTLDQDSEFYSGTYKLLLSAYDRLSDKDKTMLIAPQYIEKVVFKDTNNFLPYIENIKWNNSDNIITSGSLIRTEVFNLVGFFEEKLFIDKIDFDFCIRITKKGYICKLAKNVVFIHEFGKTTKQLIKNFNYSPQRRYYIARNSVYIFKKHFFYAPYKMIIVLIRSGIIFASIKILFFEQDKFNKIKNTYKGFIYGVLNKYE